MIIALGKRRSVFTSKTAPIGYRGCLACEDCFGARGSCDSRSCTDWWPASRLYSL